MLRKPPVSRVPVLRLARLALTCAPLLLLVLACCFAPREDPAPSASPVTPASTPPAPEAEVAPRDLGCIASTEADSSMTPVELYAAMDACARADRIHDAAVLFALAGTYGRYDTYRVALRAGHDAPSVIRMGHLNSMPPEAVASMRELQAQMAVEPGLTALCAELRRAGAPTYYPGYMIRHGATIFIPDTTPPMVAGFDGAASWDRALDEYVHCTRSP